VAVVLIAAGRPVGHSAAGEGRQGREFHSSLACGCSVLNNQAICRKITRKIRAHLLHRGASLQAGLSLAENIPLFTEAINQRLRHPGGNDVGGAGRLA